MADFLKAFQPTMGNEGGSSFNPDDTGNIVVNGIVTVPTYKGIAPVSHKTWRGFDIIKQTIAGMTKMPQWGTASFRNWRKSLDQILAANLTLQKYVLEFYMTNFWDANRLGQVNDQRVATWAFDHLVNAGARGAIWLQLAAGVKPDGGIGPVTIAAVNAAEPVYLLERCTDIAGAFRLDRGAANPSQIQFLTSWLERDGQPASIIAMVQKAAADGHLDAKEVADLKAAMAAA